MYKFVQPAENYMDNHEKALQKYVEFIMHPKIIKGWLIYHKLESIRTGTPIQV